MFTKEDLSSLKYKELVVIAKQYGIYKSRCKKVNLLNKLLSIPFDQVVINQQNSINDKFGTNLVDTTQKADCFENMMNASPALLRRETFDIVPCTDKTDGRDNKTVENDFSNIGGEILDINVPSIRRETFNKDKEENLSSAKSEISFLRQNTFNIDKPKEKLSDKSVTPATPTILRQGTFSIDKPSPFSPVRTRSSILRSVSSAKSIGQRIEIQNKNNIFEEMPGIVSKEFNNTPVKPYIINAAATCSPVRTRSSILRSVSSAKSIGQRIERQRTSKSERRPSSRGSKTQKNLSVNMVSVTPVRIHKTSVKGGRIEKKIAPSKLPNFKAIHLGEFSKMESIVEYTKRKAERTKALLTPLKLNHAENKSNGPSLVTSRIPVKFDLPKNVVEPKLTSSRGKHSVTTHAQKNVNLRMTSVSNIKDKLKFIDSPMTKVKRNAESGAVKDITNKIAPNPKKRIENVKEIVTSKMHPFSVERSRAKGRDFLQSVRMNRRFQLQMEIMRKAKV